MCTLTSLGHTVGKIHTPIVTFTILERAAVKNPTLCLLITCLCFVSSVERARAQYQGGPQFPEFPTVGVITAPHTHSGPITPLFPAAPVAAPAPVPVVAPPVVAPPAAAVPPAITYPPPAVAPPVVYPQPSVVPAPCDPCNPCAPCDPCNPCANPCSDPCYCGYPAQAQAQTVYTVRRPLVARILDPFGLFTRPRNVVVSQPVTNYYAPTYSQGSCCTPTVGTANTLNQVAGAPRATLLQRVLTATTPSVQPVAVRQPPQQDQTQPATPRTVFKMISVAAPPTQDAELDLNEPVQPHRFDQNGWNTVGQ